MNPANLITLGRVILVPVVFWLLVSGHLKGAFFLFMLAGVSDAVDGYLAKNFDWQTDLGAYLDPLADKLLIVSIFLALGVSAQLPSWIVVAVVARDFLIVAAVMMALLLGRPMRVRPILVSKANTVSQIVLAAVVMANGAFMLGLTTALVRSGILADMDERELERLYAEHGARPDYTIDRFAM